jgi:hypothetical protein
MISFTSDVTERIRREDHDIHIFNVMGYRFGVVCCVVVRGELERLDSTPLTGPLILPHVD